jgi:hypothetical protein
MQPTYHTQRRRPARFPQGRVMVPGKGDYYIVRESSPLSYSLDPDGLGFSFKSITKAVSSGFKAVTKVASTVGTLVAKTVTVPTKMVIQAYQKTGLPGGTVIGKPLMKLTNLIEQTPASMVGYSAAMIRAPFVLAKGVTTGQIGSSLHQVEQEVRVGGGKPLAALVKVGKIVVPAVLTYIMPPLGIAISAAIIARDIYIAKKENAKAKQDMENKIHDAYQTYVDGVKKGGYNPVDEATFRAWLLAGGTGNMPLGSAFASGSGPGGGYDDPSAAISPTGPAEESSIVPLILVVGAAALSDGPLSLPTPQPAPAQSSSILPWLSLGVMLYKK